MSSQATPKRMTGEEIDYVAKMTAAGFMEKFRTLLNQELSELLAEQAIKTIGLCQDYTGKII